MPSFMRVKKEQPATPAPKTQKLKDVSEVTAMVIDTGAHVELARTLGRTYKKVYYCCPMWRKQYATFRQARIGSGFPEIEVVDSPAEHKDEVDLYCYPWCGFGQDQIDLENQGKAVWGSRMGETLEFDRALLRRIMQKKGLPVNPYVEIHGMTKLREYLKAHNDVWVKISKWRRIKETFHSDNYALIERILEELEQEAGPYKEDIDMIVEQPLPDCVEVGIDSWMVDGKLPPIVGVGAEFKDSSYLGSYFPWGSVPSCVTDFDRKMAPVFADIGWRGFYSTEVRVGKDGVGYMVDLTARTPSPPYESYLFNITNLPEVIWFGANGIVVSPKVRGKWVALIMVLAPDAEDTYQTIGVPRNTPDLLVLMNTILRNGVVTVMPQPGDKLDEVGFCGGYGNTPEKAIEMAKGVAKEIKGHNLNPLVDALDDAQEEIDKAKEIGAWPKE